MNCRCVHMILRDLQVNCLYHYVINWFGDLFIYEIFNHLIWYTCRFSLALHSIRMRKKQLQMYSFNTIFISSTEQKIYISIPQTHVIIKRPQNTFISNLNKYQAIHQQTKHKSKLNNKTVQTLAKNTVC